MPDDFRDSPHDIDPSAALRALPLETPPRSAWPVIAARLPVQPRRRRLPWAVAAAAAAVLALAVTSPLHRGTVVAPDTADPEAALFGALYDESARLEALIAVAANDEVASGSAAALAAALADRVNEIDLALADPATDPALRLPLWQQRVATLRDLAGLEGTRQWLTSRGERYDGALVVAY